MNDVLLPPGTRMIHIGPPKTGSTAIQNAMHAHRDVLSDHGVYYASLGANRAREAGWAILGGSAVGRPAPRMQRWKALVEEVQSAGEQRVVTSNEDFGRATPEQIRSIVRGLGGESPHVVYVVRRIDRFLPSMWQERVKARDTRGYDDWLKVVLAESSDGWLWNHIWQAQRVGDVVNRWTQQVGEENMTLVISDEQDRALLPTTFEQLLGLPSGTLTTDVRRGNRSLSYEEVELVRRSNRAFQERKLSDWAYASYMQGGAVKGLIQSAPPGAHQKLSAVPEWARERIVDLAWQQADFVRKSGVRVVGDPDGLERVESDSVDPSAPSQIDNEVAAHAVHGVIAKGVKTARPEVRGGQKQMVSSKNESSAPGKPKRGNPGSPLIAETSTRQLVGVVAKRAAQKLRRR